MTPLPALLPALFLALAACGGVVETSSSSASTSSSGGAGGAAPAPYVPNACAAACGTHHAGGLVYYNVVIGQCVCASCSPSCTKRVCDERLAPSDACLPCVQNSLEGDACKLHAGLLQSGCIGHPECAALVACLDGCH